MLYEQKNKVKFQPNPYGATHETRRENYSIYLVWKRYGRTNYVFIIIIFIMFYIIIWMSELFNTLAQWLIY